MQAESIDVCRVCGHMNRQTDSIDVCHICGHITENRQAESIEVCRVCGHINGTNEPGDVETCVTGHDYMPQSIGEIETFVRECQSIEFLLNLYLPAY